MRSLPWATRHQPNFQLDSFSGRSSITPSGPRPPTHNWPLPYALPEPNSCGAHGSEAGRGLGAVTGHSSTGRVGVITVMLGVGVLDGPPWLAGDELVQADVSTPSPTMVTVHLAANVRIPVSTPDQRTRFRGRRV